MPTAINAAKLHVELALAAKDRDPRDRWRRERYEYALVALERIQAMDLETAGPRPTTPDAA